MTLSEPPDTGRMGNNDTEFVLICGGVMGRMSHSTINGAIQAKSLNPGIDRHSGAEFGIPVSPAPEFLAEAKFFHCRNDAGDLGDSILRTCTWHPASDGSCQEGPVLFP